MNYPSTDPTELFHRRESLFSSDLLLTAISELDFFNWLARHPSDARAICGALHLASRPVDVMLTLFAAMGLVTCKDGTYLLTTLAKEHLVNTSPWDLAPYFGSAKRRPISRAILTVLQTGKPLGWATTPDEQEWARAMEDEAFSTKFTAAMDSRGAYLAPVMAKALDCAGAHRLLDIGGSSGVYACALVSAHPHLQAAVLEKPPVDKATQRALDKRGFAERVSVIPGDMFSEPLPLGYDLHLYSHVLHDWDEPSVHTLIERSFVALPPGGRVVIHGAHLLSRESGPLPVAEYSVLLMLSTEGKCYAVDELETMLTKAGFADATYIPTVAHRSLIIAQKPVSGG